MIATPADRALAEQFAGAVPFVLVGEHAPRHPDLGERQFADIDGFEISDQTVDDQDWIWVGYGGEGRWLKPEQVFRLANALNDIAQAQVDRGVRS